MKQYLLGIDLGTTACKSMVFDLEGNILGKGYVEYDLIFTPEGVEQDAEAWWKYVCVTVREAVSQVGAENIAALSVSAQGIAGVPIGADGMPLMNALSWLDNRSTREMEALCKEYGKERLFCETGKNPGAYTLPQVMWLKNHREALFVQMKQYLLSMDFLMQRMTGRALTDYSMACGTMAYHIGEKRWMHDLLKQTGVGAIFAPVGCMGDKVGKLLPKAAKELGLQEDTIVALGAQDQKCSALGAGIEKGMVTTSLGTSAAMCSLADMPIIDEERFVTCCGMDESHWLMETTITTAGAALKWLKNTLFENSSYDDLDCMAQQSPCGAGGVLFFPHFTVNSNKEASGTFTGIGLSTTKEDIIRSVMEGVSYVLASHVKYHENVGEEIRKICLFGGGAQSAVWRQILADITGIPVILPSTHETGCLGAAILAAKGAGLIGDVYHPNKMLQKPESITQPIRQNHETYLMKEKAYYDMDRCIRKNRNIGGHFYE